MRSRGQGPGREYQIALIDKLVRVLDAMRDEPGGLTLQDLAARTGYVKSSIHRMLGSLKRHGYVEQTAAGGPYRLGVQCLLLARGLKEGIELLRHARPFLQDFVDTFNESAYLAIVRGGRGIFVEVNEAKRRDLRLVGPLGASVHYHATAAGKVLAAFLPPQDRELLLERIDLPRLTPRTLTTKSEVEREWTLVTRRGVALNREESIVGAVFLAAPIQDADGNVCACISVGVPKARYSPELGQRIAQHLKASCGQLSGMLRLSGYTHDDHVAAGRRRARARSRPAALRS
jgi:DNA-binding IclR family transcriptional regulator